MADSTISTYNILNFIDDFKKENPDRYNQLKEQAINVYISRSTRSIDPLDDIKSNYTALWDGTRVCGQTNLELNELEELIEQDRLSLGEKEGITVFIKGGSRRIQAISRP